MTWLPDLQKWGEIIAHFLKKGGLFYIKDGHPLAKIVSVDSTQSPPIFHIQDKYFESQPHVYNDGISYAGNKSIENNKTNYQWDHTMSKIIQSLINAGLTITKFEEYPYDFFHRYDQLAMKQDKNGRWVLPEPLDDFIPLSFMIQAYK